MSPKTNVPKNKTKRVKTDISEIIKRDGRIVPFEQDKITIAILGAMRVVKEGRLADAAKVTKFVIKDLNKDYQKAGEVPSVEQIQDIVERNLILTKFPGTAKAYILHRDLHSRRRNIDNLLDVGGKITDYINRTDSKIHFDSEIDYHLQGLYKNISNEVSERYWMNEVYTVEMKYLHYNRDIKIHKSSALSAYCVGWDLEDLLRVGYKGVAGNIASKPAKHFSSALGQLMNFLYTLTNEAPDGAVAVSSIDTYIAPFIRYDKLTYKQVRQGIQSFIFNLNMPTKSGGQVVFSNITLDLQCPKHMEKQPVIRGGELQGESYGEFQKEMDMFNRALVEIYVEGDTNGRAFTWPIPTYNITKDFDWDNKNLKGLWEMTAKYGIPYFANFINSDMEPEDARSMCCRLRIDKRVLKKRGGGLFGANPLTGSIGYVTINLPRLGYLHKGNKKNFFKRLEQLLEVSDEVLSMRRKVVESFTEKGMYPYSKFYLRVVKEQTGSYWTNHFNTVGILGMNEACLNFFGKDITTKEGQEFAVEVLDFINKKMLAFQKKSGELYNLEASPAESTCYELAKKDKQIYPNIIVANEDEYQKGAAPYYTNSTQLPVGFTDDVFEALDLQDDLQCKYTGGTVFHSFLGERLNSGDEARVLIKKIAQKYKLPYFTLCPTFSICESHGYVRGEHFECPDCGEECRVYSRVVGKIAPVQRWNPGKQSEFKQRKVFCPSGS